MASLSKYLSIVLLGFFPATSVTVHAEDNLIDGLNIELGPSRVVAGQPTTIKIVNQDSLATWVWFGACSLFLRDPNSETRDYALAGWSGCPMCGQEREMPTPIFLAPNEMYVLEWNTQIFKCEDGIEFGTPLKGTYRICIKSAEDEYACSESDDPLKCWVAAPRGTWHVSCSPKFTVAGK